MDGGYLSLVAALISAAIACIMFLYTARRGGERNIGISRIGVFGQVLFLTSSSLILLYYLLVRDFQVQYVASYTDRSLPFMYTVGAFWAGAEGSLLLWSWIQSLFILGVMLKERGDEMTHYTLSILSSVNFFFLLVLVSIGNPFKRLDFTPADGMGLNPLLVNHGMWLHPPALFLGYAGMTIPFAFALAGLTTENEVWIFRTRKWSLFSWLWLSLGIFFGGLWSYTVLGWGGYWAWDPVENASLIPWLFATALLHSVMIQESRRGMKLWNILLAILTFETVIFATFLTRSGVLSSVHAFGKSEVGVVFVAYLGVTLVFSIAVLAWKFPQVRSRNIFESVFARESSFLFNNLLLVVAGVTVFWGTVFPLINEAVMGTKMNVGPEFYNEVNGPIIYALAGLAGVCVALEWRRTGRSNLISKFKYPLAAGVSSVPMLYLLGFTDGVSLLGFALIAFAIATHLQEYVLDLAAHKRKGFGIVPSLYGTILASRRRYGGYIVHLSMFLILIGIIGSQLYASSYPLTLKQDEPAQIGEYTFVFEGQIVESSSDKIVRALKLSVRDGAGSTRVLSPSLTDTRESQLTTVQVAVLSLPLKDIYIIPQGVEDRVASLRVSFFPLIGFIWSGGVIMILGVTVCLLPKRRSSVES